MNVDINAVWQSPRGAAKAGCLLQLTWTQREHVNKSLHYIISPLFPWSIFSLHTESSSSLPSARYKVQPGNGWCCLIPHFHWHSTCILKFATEVQGLTFHLLSETAWHRADGLTQYFVKTLRDPRQQDFTQTFHLALSSGQNLNLPISQVSFI